MFFGDYIDSPTSPLFAFGHGLSYSTFEYSDFSVQATNTTGPIEVSIDVRNTGEREGSQVVQLYCREEVASVARPERILLGFARLSLAAGHASRITFTVHPSRLAFYDPHMRFVTEPGDFTFSIGASSADIRDEKTVALTGDITEYLQREIVATQVEIKD